MFAYVNRDRVQHGIQFYPELQNLQAVIRQPDVNSSFWWTLIIASHCYTARMAIPTEQIGSIPRPPQLLESIKSFETGGITAKALERCSQQRQVNFLIVYDDSDVTERAPLYRLLQNRPGDFVGFPL